MPRLAMDNLQPLHGGPQAGPVLGDLGNAIG
jgi:hypothetical protein